jgi:TolB protein
MDYDGQNQRQMTQYHDVAISPALSPDNSRIAFTRLNPPSVTIHATSSGRRMTFVNPQASMNATPEFTPDGHVIFSSTLGGGFANLYIANGDGSGLRRLTNVRAVEVEPRVNPKTGRELLFISGRGGKAQLYMMSIDGTGVDRLTDGRGEASNPSWSPDGQNIAFAWTAGYDPGNWSIFIMNLASRRYTQVTSGVRSENPSWGPDGRHIVFSRTMGRRVQLYSMLADGSQMKQLTHTGNNEKPAWTR